MRHGRSVLITPERQRKIRELRDKYGLSWKAIGERYGCGAEWARQGYVYQFWDEERASA